MDSNKDVDEINDMIETYYASLPSFKTKRLCMNIEKREINLLRKLFSHAFDKLEYDKNIGYQKAFNKKDIDASFESCVKDLMEYYNMMSDEYE
jgi:hypothetical protein